MKLPQLSLRDLFWLVIAMLTLTVGCHDRTEVEDDSKEMLIQPKPTQEEEAATELWVEAMREHERLKGETAQIAPAVSDLVHSVDYNNWTQCGSF